MLAGLLALVQYGKDGRQTENFAAIIHPSAVSCPAGGQLVNIDRRMCWHNQQDPRRNPLMDGIDALCRWPSGRLYLRPAVVDFGSLLGRCRSAVPARREGRGLRTACQG